MLKIIDLPGDSGNYEVLADMVQKTANVPGIACEIGLRRGGGTRFLIEEISKQENKRIVVAIDPYGNIDYNTVVDNTGPKVVKLDYTNTMRNQCMVNVFEFAEMKNVNFIFFNLEDTEFFKRFADGIPVYEEYKRLETVYSIVHFDGPHFTEDVINEIEFFMPRTVKGSGFVFDDVSYYEHNKVDEILINNGWEISAKSPHKWSYIRS